MKQYFLKYLRITGEIGVGDVFLSKWKQLHKFYHYVHVTAIDDEYYYEGNAKYKKDDAISKVVLRLCSRKFNVGDEITSNLTDCTYFIPATEEHVKNSHNVDNNNQYFTVIDGELSPAALPFITVGDNFNEDEICKEVNESAADWYEGMKWTYKPIKFKCPWGCFH
jgi:hypothetical protein